MLCMAREELDKYVADDDSLTVQCDVSVVETLVVKVQSACQVEESTRAGLLLRVTGPSR
jgi:hypothetical protein